MLFNSYAYLLLFSICFCLYWTLGKKQVQFQNVFLLFTSYVFYAFWDWRFLGLVVFSSLIDFYIGLRLFETNTPSKRKIFLIGSVLVNIGLLAYFKYANFFINSFIEFSDFIGLKPNVGSLNIILPVGISFYTFQTLSYTIDIYKKKMEPTKSIISFFTFVSFFPQLVAGPIERASNLLPQFQKCRVFEEYEGRHGLRQILWGLFKKIVIADNCALVVNSIFASSEVASSLILFLGAVLFAFQIYADFSAYSDIAIGSARLLGIKLMQNFDTPYFSSSISEFWRRWHVSLSTWFRDYVYIPLGGSRVSNMKQARNIIITFTVSGLWHGANWTYVFWGFLNGLYMLPRIFFPKFQLDKEQDSRFFLISASMLTFVLTCFTWVFFRSESIGHAFQYIGGIFEFSLSSDFDQTVIPLVLGVKLLVGIMILLIFDWLYRHKNYTFDISNCGKPTRWGLYFILLGCIFFFGSADSDVDFIYFQF